MLDSATLREVEQTLNLRHKAILKISDLEVRIANFQAQIKIAKQQISNFEEFAIQYLHQHSMKSQRGEVYLFGIKESKGKLVIAEDAKLPEKYLKCPVTIPKEDLDILTATLETYRVGKDIVDKIAIKKDIENGNEIDGAKIVPTISLQVTS